MKIYVVKQGDSVDSIAESQGIPVETGTEMKPRQITAP